MLEFPSTRPGEPIKISASTFVAYSQCPAMAGARFQGVFGADSVAAFKGGLSHAVFARHLAQGPIADDVFESTCKQLIGSSNLNHKVAALRLRPSEVSGAIEEARTLYERFKKIPDVGFAGAEVLIEIDLPVDVTLVGRIDAIFDAEGGVRLVDWKTGDLGDPAEQLRFYALLWVIERGRLPSAVEAYSVRDAEPYRSTPSSTEVSATAQSVADLVDAVRAAWESGAALPLRGGPWCRYCPLLPSCDEGVASVAIIDGHPLRPAATENKI